MKKRFNISFTVAIILFSLFCVGPLFAVTSKLTRHNSGQDLLKGQKENIVISSKGVIKLGRKAQSLTKDFNDVWSINCIVVNAGTVFFGTSPNGGIYQYSLGKLTEIYSAASDNEEIENVISDSNEPNEPNVPADTNTIEKDEHLANEHIFAMATDISGRLLAGISGKKSALCRLEAGRLETVFEPNDVKYIFAIAVADDGRIYLGTGPEGKIYSLNSLCKDPELVYDSTDKNILSLLIADDGSVYAGSDTRGLIYKIEPESKTATVLYDSDQDEITSLLLANNNLYVAATSAKFVAAQKKFAKELPLAGRPEKASENKNDTGNAGGGLKLKIANTKETGDSAKSKPKPAAMRPGLAGQASYIYKITPEGFVTDVFREAAVFFALAQNKKEILLGTGNNAQLYSITPSSEQEMIIYEDEQASQITAVAVSGDEIYLGTANPAKLIKIENKFASQGVYTSELIDATQPANWGKLQIEAEIPDSCRVMTASRSGNVQDVNDPTFSQWTEPQQVTEPVQLDCPLGRYCQYKLVLKNDDGLETPIIREIAVANTVPNLEPKVHEVTVDRIPKPDKKGILKISCKADDDNGDKLIYKIDFRKLGRDLWIELKDELEQDSFEWDAKTVEDGRYEIKVTTSDERSNTAHTKLTASRISEPVVVDNTAPTIEEYSLISNGNKLTITPAEIGGGKLTIKLTVTDVYSAIGRLDYTIDSNNKWISAVPDDLVYDTTDENFTIVIDKLEKGEHIISVRVRDDIENTGYKTFEVNITGK